MAYTNGFESLSDHTTRSRESLTSLSRDNSLFSFFSEEPSTSTSRPTSFGMPTPQSNFSDGRGSLQRRFTINNAAPNLFSGLSSMGQDHRHLAGFSPPDLSFAIKSHQGQRADRKSAERDYIRQKQLQFESAQNEIDRLELQIQQRKEQLRRDRAQATHNGHQSEPTTPPEYRDGGFPTSLSRPNRFSTSTLASPPGLTTRTSRAGSQVIAQPSSERARAYHALTGQSLPQTRDNSDEGEDDLSDGVWDFNHRSAASLNRNSMPVTRRDRSGVDFSSVIGPVNTTAFLFGDDQEASTTAQSNDHSNRSSTVRGGFLQMNTNDDKFPVLIRRETDGKLQLPPSSNALDLASPEATEQETPSSNGWNSYRARSHNKSQSSIMNRNSLTLNGTSSPPQSSSQPGSSGDHTPTKGNRHSMGSRIGLSPTDTQRHLSSASISSDSSSGGAPKLQSSYSTNDIPTVKSTNNAGSYGQSVTTAEERLHNHNASLGRIPRGAIGSNRTSRDFKELSQSPELRHEEPIPTMQTVLQGSASNFGTSSTVATTAASTNVSQAPATGAMTSTETMTSPVSSPGSFSSAPPSNVPLPSVNNSNASFYGGYGVQPGAAGNASNNMMGLSAMMNNMNMGMAGGVQSQWAPPNAQFMNGNPQAYSAAFAGPSMFPQYPGQGQQNRFPDSQARVMQQRRNQSGEEHARFANIALENLQGEIYGLCKDQHGCRYLQKKLEEGKPDQVQIIFDETKTYMVDLMTDPFGNYLCQKLLEQTNEDQRTVLINSAAPHMVRIALNQHGTRALQKMIEYVSTPAQVQTVIVALRDQVVPMIQDLNGNHVIQKCLNRLSAEDAQFIFDAVASHCVVVGTHRHGCCVIQRCIDHASGNQKAQLVAAITASSYPLVQDPFGNYVLQYIFDQGEESFSQPLCRTFLGAIAMLSKQKFSSNVIEKCIRIADADLKHEMIEEIINCPDFERLADDAFANYVVQTAWDYANGEDEERLAEKIRPVLPRMRHKPYGRRFQSRLVERDTRLGITSPVSTTSTTSEVTPALSGTTVHRSQPSNDSSFYQSPPGSSHGVQINPAASFAAMNPAASFAAQGGYSAGANGFVPQGRRMSNATFSNASTAQGSSQQVFHAFGPGNQQGQRMNYF